VYPWCFLQVAYAVGVLVYSVLVINPAIRRLDASLKRAQFLLMMFPEDVVITVMEIKNRMATIAKRSGRSR
jgi:hypothetical protein